MIKIVYCIETKVLNIYHESFTEGKMEFTEANYTISGNVIIIEGKDKKLEGPLPIKIMVPVQQTIFFEV